MVCYTKKHHIKFQIDDEDYERVSQHTWCCNSAGYVSTNINKRYVSLHQFIMNTPVGMETDHINGDVSDNRKRNLRICSHAENQHNQRPRNGSSQYKGVLWHKQRKKWMAQIRVDNKNIYLGLFDNEINAAIAYNKKASEYFGEYVWLNIIK